MISSRVTLNELPYDVADEILCIEEITDDEKYWELISSTSIPRSYKLTPKPQGPSWFVRWDFDYSWANIRDALVGGDQATQDWKNVNIEDHHRLPIVYYRFIVSPRPCFFNTLLVTEHIEDTKSLENFFKEETSKRLAIEDTFIQYRELLANVHEQGIVHNNFTLSNTIIQCNDATRQYITEWYDM
jgi:hypothetical protein